MLNSNLTALDEKDFWKYLSMAFFAPTILEGRENFEDVSIF
jgi:hypothetical protein